VWLWSVILKEVLNLSVSIVYDYGGECKEYVGEYYKRFKKEYKVPENLWYEIRNSESLHYYNTRDELEAYINLWSPRVSAEMFEHFSASGFGFYTRITLENRSEGKLHVNHYIDNGCTCDICNKQRSFVRHLVESGNHKGEKVIHPDT